MAGARYAGMLKKKDSPYADLLVSGFDAYPALQGSPPRVLALWHAALRERWFTPLTGWRNFQVLGLVMRASRWAAYWWGWGR